MKLFLKSIIVGLGGVAPGLSGSVLMILFGMYQNVLEALGTLFVDFKKKARYLLPIVSGMVVGVLLFSRMLNYCLNRWEVPPRFAFLGLILGTVPLFYTQVKKEGFSKKYWVVILLSFCAATALFTLNPGLFPQITQPNLAQKLLLGVAVAASAIIPGVDPAVLLSTLGLYETYVAALAELRLDILLPMAVGLGAGAIAISFLMSRLFRRFYTMGFSVIFGVFLAMIPNMLSENCYLGWDLQSVVSVICLVAGFFLSFFLGKLEERS